MEVVRPRGTGSRMLGMLVALFVLAAPCLRGHAEVLTIRGALVDQAARPVSGAVVVTERGGSAVSASDGSFSLPLDLPPNLATIRVTAVATTDGGTLQGHKELRVAGQHAEADAGTIRMLASKSCDPSWLPTFGGFPGVNLDVHALAVFDDGSGGGPALYAAGAFNLAGGIAVSKIVKWDGASWTALSTGIDNSIYALAVYDDGLGGGPALYAGGNFTTIAGQAFNRIARWNGSTWSQVGSGVTGGNPVEVRALTVFAGGTGPELIAAGSFLSAGGSPANRVARWNGVQWKQLGGGVSDIAFALRVHDDGSGPALFVGGGFFTAGGLPASRIAKWNGASWSALGIGVNNNVHALEVHDDGLGAGTALYVGGEFTQAGGVLVNRIARWNGAAWSALGSGFNEAVRALAAYDDGTGGGPSLFAGGDFTMAGALTVNKVARWKAGAWSAFGSGVSSTVRALIVFGGSDGSTPKLVLGGDFNMAGPYNARRLVQWNGVNWSLLDHGVSFNGTVHAMLVFDNGLGAGPQLHIGGTFVSIGTKTLNRIARWDGTQWSSLGSGLGGTCHALAAFAGESGGPPQLYAAGEFQTAGTVAANRIARWTGTSWQALGTGLDDFAFALEVHSPTPGGPPRLHVGGRFLFAAGILSPRVAMWTGSQWLAVGGFDLLLGTTVFALKSFDDGQGDGPQLYAGGSFSTTSGSPANGIARRSGTQWVPLGSGAFGVVFDIEGYDDGTGDGPELYVGGNFPTAGGVVVNSIARWDGSSWSALGNGLSNGAGETVVRAMAVLDDGHGDGPALFVVGNFNSADGSPASNFARWGGRNCPFWTGIPSTFNAIVYAVTRTTGFAGVDSALIMGGSFQTSSAADSYLARWVACPVIDCDAADLDCDGLVNGDDLGTLLGLWGECDPCEFDFDCNGEIDESDLGYLFDHWTG